MELEEHSNEDLEDRCEECGAVLSEAEMADVLEADGPNLCAVCASDSGVADDD